MKLKFETILLFTIYKYILKMRYKIKKTTYVSGNSKKTLSIFFPKKFSSIYLDGVFNIKVSSLNKKNNYIYIHNNVIQIITEIHNKLPIYMRKISHLFISNTVNEIIVTDSPNLYIDVNTYIKNIKIGEYGRCIYQLDDREILQIISKIIYDTFLTKDHIVSNLISWNSFNTKKVLNNKRIDIMTLKKCNDCNYVIHQIKNCNLLEDLLNKEYILFNPINSCYSLKKD